MGSGGLGSCVGGLLSRVGEDVTLIARGANLEAIRANGLTLKTLDFGEISLALKATSDPAEVGPVDLVVFSVKTYDTEDAAEQMRPLIGPNTVVFSLQNGIDGEDRIANIIGREHVIGAVSNVVAHVEEPGVVAQIANGGILLGELDGGTSNRVEQTLKTLESAGIKAELRTDIRVAMWEKLCIFLALAGVETLTRLPAGPLKACPETQALMTGMVKEIAAVAEADGVISSEESESFVKEVLGVHAAFPPNHTPSMYYDLMAGKRLELDSLNGALVRLGQRLGVPTPLNFAIYAALKPYADGRPRLA